MNLPLLKRLSLCMAIALPLLGTSCGLLHPQPPKKATAVLYEWEDDGGPGEVSVKINLAACRTYIPATE